MIGFFAKRRLPLWCRATLASTAALALLAGCGGGGGGGSSSGGGSSAPQSVTVTGQLKDKTTTNVLPNRTVTIQGSSLRGVSDAQGMFSIGAVPISNVTLTVVDSNGASDGTAGPYDLSKLSGDPRSVGVVTLDIYGSGGPPPPPSP